MQVDVVTFGWLRERLGGTERTTVELAEPATVATLLAGMPLPPGAQASLAVAVNREYARADTPLADRDEVALLPPVSGGAPAETTLRVEILDGELPTAEVLAGLKAGADGAVCLFDGIVRDNTRGRQTLFLDYEAYREMALAQMQALAAEALTRFPVRDVALLHRLGRLHVGETSVLIAVASAHRGAAFDACRWLIDTLKRQVPIWKRETFADGVVWADGEPFPEDIALHLGKTDVGPAEL